MTLQNLNKLRDRYESQLGLATSSNQFEHLKGLPFYCGWDQSGTPKSANFTRCCFNHFLGLPEKNGWPMPMFDYEQSLFNELQNHKYLWIKKATGLGVTEFMLRYMAWLCFQITKKLQFSNPQMCIWWLQSVARRRDMYVHLIPPGFGSIGSASTSSFKGRLRITWVMEAVDKGIAVFPLFTLQAFAVENLVQHIKIRFHT